MNNFSTPKKMAIDLHREAREASAKANPEGLTVTNTRASLVSIAGLKFLPGDTKTIPPEYADRVRNHQWFRMGILVEGRQQMPVPRVVAKPADLSGFDDEKALAFIRLETSLAILHGWAKNEVRPAIIDALAERAAEI